MSVNKGKKSNSLSQTFIDNTKDLAEDQMLEKIYDTLEIIKQVEEEKKNDDKLNAAKEIAKDLSKGYSSMIANEKAKINHLRDKIRDMRNDSDDI